MTEDLTNLCNFIIIIIMHIQKEPKLKLSNLMRVLKDQAVANPSSIEAQVRSQVAERLKNHEMGNLARKLTPLERAEKKTRKLTEDTSTTVHVAIFRVDDLTSGKVCVILQFLYNSFAVLLSFHFILTFLPSF